MKQFLFRLLSINKIYSRKTFWAILIDYGLVGAAIVGFALHAPGRYEVLTGLAAVVWGYALARTVCISVVVRGRIHQVRHLSNAVMGMTSEFTISAVNDEQKNIDRIHNIDGGPDWQLYETEVDIYRHTKNGEYLSRQIFYTVLELKLARALPNIVFDSAKAKGHQFKYVYLESQRISLEGNFDKSFTMYAPQHYQIDTLSFITPEVMQAMQAADDYDLEIASDRLFLYGPLLLNPTDMERVKQLGQNLVSEINDNIDTYADSYLAGPNRKTAVTQFARQLLQSPLKPGLRICGWLLILVAVGIFGHLVHINFLANQFCIAFYVFIAVDMYRLVKIIRDNKRAKAGFAKELQMQAYARKYRSAIFGRNRS